jgi:hypothetical protein
MSATVPGSPPARASQLSARSSSNQRSVQQRGVTKFYDAWEGERGMGTGQDRSWISQYKCPGTFSRFRQDFMFKTGSYAAPHIPLYQGILGLNPRLE